MAPSVNYKPIIYNRFSSNTIATLAMSYSSAAQTDYMEIRMTGGSAYGVTAWSSDRKLKDNIKDTDENGLEKILAIEHRQFDWKKNGDHVRLGYVAQELEEIDPSFVLDVGDNKQVNQVGLIPAITKSIQEMMDIINEQQAQINELKEEIAVLKENKK